MKRYLIKCTYLDGPHRGKTYLLEKGGYVASDVSKYFEDRTYKTLNIAKRRCKQLQEANELNVRLDKYGIYFKEAYEPHEVEVY